MHKNDSEEVQTNNARNYINRYTFEMILNYFAWKSASIKIWLNFWSEPIDMTNNVKITTVWWS